MGSTGVRGNHSNVRKTPLCASEHHVGEHPSGVEHQLKHRNINLEVDSQRSPRDSGMHEQCDLASIHLFEPWIEAWVSQVYVFHASQR
jgi:hypothetical protein